MSLIWLFVLYKCYEAGMEISDISFFMTSILYVGDCILMKGKQVKMSKETIIFDKLCDFINRHNVSCPEDVHQRDSVNLECVELVADMVEIVMEEA